MKKLVILAFAAVVSIFGGKMSFAQDKYGATPQQSQECVKYLSYYEEYYKQRDYNNALPNWRHAFSVCPPSCRQKMLLDGAALMRQLITKTADEKYKGELIDTLLTIHDLRVANFPSYAATALNNKGLDIMTYVKDNDEFVFAELKKVISANGTETNPNILVFLMNEAVTLYNNGKLDQESVLMEYESAMELLDEIAKVKPDENIANYTTPIDNLFIQSKVADCDKLIELFTPRFAADPEKTAAGIVRTMLASEGCTDNDLFVQAVATMHRLNPSNTSAYSLFKIYSSRGDMDNATDAILQAVAFDNVTDDQRAEYYFELAQQVVAHNGSNAKAIEYAAKAAQLNTDNTVAGKAYLLCGTVWGASVCKGNEIEARAPYWVAVDYLERARRADPSLADTCNKQIAQYSKFFPDAADAFMYDVTDGQSYVVSCNGLTANTTVRTQK